MQMPLFQNRNIPSLECQLALPFNFKSVGGARMVQIVSKSRNEDIEPLFLAEQFLEIGWAVIALVEQLYGKFGTSIRENAWVKLW